MQAAAIGWKDVVADSAAGVEMRAKRCPAADVALETRRFQPAADASVMTDCVKANGKSGADKAREFFEMVTLFGCEDNRPPGRLQ